MSYYNEQNLILEITSMSWLHLGGLSSTENPVIQIANTPSDLQIYFVPIIPGCFPSSWPT